MPHGRQAEKGVCMGVLEGRVAIVTGAASGIGKATTGRFVEEGARVCMVDLSREALEQSAADLGLAEGAYVLAPANITNEDEVKAAVEACVAAFGTVNVLCNIAGIGGPGASVVDYTVEEFRRVLDVNVVGSYAMIRNVLPIMQEQDGGVILNTSSGDATAAYTYEIGYSASKAAVKQMTRNIANELGEGGKIRCCSVSPGWVLTPMATGSIADFSGMDFGNSSEIGDLGPIGRMIDPAEIAGVFCFLASDEASILNGIDVIADGGKTLGKA